MRTINGNGTMPKQLINVNVEKLINGTQFKCRKSIPSFIVKNEYVPSDARPTNAPHVENVSNVLRPTRSTKFVEPYTPNI